MDINFLSLISCLQFICNTEIKNYKYRGKSFCVCTGSPLLCIISTADPMNREEKRTLNIEKKMKSFKSRGNLIDINLI